MDLPMPDKFDGHRPAIFLIDPLFTRRHDHLDLADKINRLTGMSNEHIETLILDMVCCHVIIGDPDQHNFDVDSQYSEWLAENDQPMTDDELASATAYCVDLHLRVYRPLFLNNEHKICKLNSADYNYSWRHIDDDRSIALIFKVE